MTVTAHRLIPHRTGVFVASDLTFGWFCAQADCLADREGLSEADATLEAHGHEQANWSRP